MMYAYWTVKVYMIAW